MRFFKRTGILPTDENWETPKRKRFRKDGTDEMQDIAHFLEKAKIGDRFQNGSYLKQTQSKSGEAVFKVMSGARGRQCLQNIIRYISREADYMDDKEPITLETDDGTIIQGKEAQDALIKKWMANSGTAEAYKKQEWKLKELERVNERHLKLSHKEEQGTLTKEEKTELESLARTIKTQRYTEPARDIDLSNPENAEEKKKLQRQVKGLKYAATQQPLSEKDKSRLERIEKALKSGMLHIPEREIDLRVKTPDDAMHILLSVGGQGHNKENAMQAARQFLIDNFGSAGYNYAFTMHEDTDNLHFHVALRSQNNHTQKNLCLNKDDLFHLRQDFAYQLNKQGIEPRGATLRKDREVTLESIKKQADSLFKRASWYQDQVKKSKAVDAIGYETTALRQTERLLKLTKTEKGKIFQSQSRYEEVSTLEKSLREHKADLMNFTGPTFAKKADLTLEKLTKENQELTKKTQEILNLPDTARGGGGGLSRRKENQQKYLERHQKDIQRAISAITEANKYADPAQRQANQAMLETLKKLEKAVKPKGFRLGW